MIDIETFFKKLFLIIFVFSINFSASAMHIHVYVNKEFYTGFILELKDRHKVIKDLYYDYDPTPTKSRIDFLNKIDGKVIKEDNEFYSEILELSEKKADLNANEHGKKYTANKWRKEYDYVVKRMIEILNSLV